MDFSAYNFVYNAEAHFKGMDKFPEGVMEVMQKPGKQGFDALCWMLAETSVQGELIRRDLGYDKGKVLTEEYLHRHLSLKEINKAREIALETLIKGLKGENDDEKEIDEVLMEIEKKTEED